MAFLTCDEKRHVLSFSLTLLSVRSRLAARRPVSDRGTQRDVYSRFSCRTIFYFQKVALLVFSLLCERTGNLVGVVPAAGCTPPIQPGQLCIHSGGDWPILFGWLLFVGRFLFFFNSESSSSIFFVKVDRARRPNCRARLPCSLQRPTRLTFCSNGFQDTRLSFSLCCSLCHKDTRR